MIRQDIIALKICAADLDMVKNPSRERIEALRQITRMVFLAPSKAGVDAILKAGQKLAKKFPDMTFFPTSGGISVVPSLMVTMTEGEALYHAIVGRKGNPDLDVHVTDVPMQVAVLNAEQMKLEFDRMALDTRMADYFGPLFDAAIEARDKARITELFNQFPQSVAKSFIVDRLMFGTKEKNNEDAFPELRDKTVTLQNWHLEAKA